MPVQKIKDKLNVINETLLNLTSEPEKFLIAQPEKCKDIEQMLLEMYGVTIENDLHNRSNPEILPEILVEDMDTEQIWQQLELRNNLVLNDFITKTAKLLAIRETKLEIHLKEDEDESEEAHFDEDHNNELEAMESDEDEIDGDEEKEKEEESMDEDEDDYEENSNRKQRPKRKSIVDDKFFKLDEMQAFLEAEEAKIERKQKGKPLAKEEGIDYFAEDLGAEEDLDEMDSNPEYKDFFDIEEYPEEKEKPKSKDESNSKRKKHLSNYKNIEEDSDENSNEEGNDEEMDDDEDNMKNDDKNDDNDEKMHSGSEEDKNNSEESGEEDKPKSSFELRQARLEERIRDYESEVLGEKPWQLKGEIQGPSRPQNSLLEEVLEFDSTVRPAPIVTEETTRCLEDIIKQRIRNQAWDDVERVIKPVKTPQDYRKQLVLDQEKSKESLSHIYEKEFQKQMEKLDPNRDSNNPEEPKEHQDIRKLMRDLFVKLDALSNFHFTPKPVAPEPKIVTNIPAVLMEEVAPVSVSDANLLAPEEIFRGPKYELVGKSERTKVDKKRALRKKKSKQKAIHNAFEAKDLERQRQGLPLTKKEESAKLMKKLTKQRNVEKTTASNDQGALKSSKAFFSKLQDQTNNKLIPIKKKQNAKSLSAKKLKL